MTFEYPPYQEEAEKCFRLFEKVMALRERNKLYVPEDEKSFVEADSTDAHF